MGHQAEDRFIDTDAEDGAVGIAVRQLGGARTRELIAQAEEDAHDEAEVALAEEANDYEQSETAGMSDSRR